MSPQVSVLWVDAHADLNTGRSSLSGNMHGMSVAYLLRSMLVNRLQNGFPQPWSVKHNRNEFFYSDKKDLVFFDNI